MPKSGDIISAEVMPDMQKQVVVLNSKELGQELAKLKETSVSDLVIKTGVEDYGFPADAKERRM